MFNKKIIFPILLLVSGIFCFAQENNDIKWLSSKFGDFTIKIEPHTHAIMTPNLAMHFTAVFQLLRQNIPWMISGKSNIEVYQDKNSFLSHNKGIAEDWSGAYFDPDRNIIVMYDEPKRVKRMMKKFTHELTHLFVENTFNPPSSKAPKKEPPVWLNEGLAVNMEDLALTTKGGVWNNDLIMINIFSGGEHETLKERKKSGGLTVKEKEALKKFAVTDKIVFFKNFVDFVEPNSYDKALAEGKVDDWYLQAYAMVRFLFNPENSTTPTKYLQFKQFTESLTKYTPKKDSNGRYVTTENGQKIMVRPSIEEALRTSYRYKDILDFEADFWHWLTRFQFEARKKIKKK